MSKLYARLSVYSPFFTLFCILCFASVANADTVVSYNFAGSFVADPGTTFMPVTMGTGSVVIDSTTGKVTSIDVTVNPVGVGTTFQFTGSGSAISQYSFLSYYEADVYDSTNTDLLELIFPTATIIGFSGGGLCSLAVQCPDSNFFIDSGYLTQVPPYTGGLAVSATLSAGVTATPEPSSFILLGTGVVSLAELVRRKCRLVAAFEM